MGNTKACSSIGLCIFKNNVANCARKNLFKISKQKQQLHHSTWKEQGEGGWTSDLLTHHGSSICYQGYLSHLNFSSPSSFINNMNKIM